MSQIRLPDGFAVQVRRRTLMLGRHDWPVSWPAVVLSRHVRGVPLAAAFTDCAVGWTSRQRILDNKDRTIGPPPHFLRDCFDDGAQGAALWLGVPRGHNAGPLQPQICF